MDQQAKRLAVLRAKEELIKRIEQDFAAVELGQGVSWREAGVIDDYGSTEARKVARAQDETKDWTKIPFELIGDLSYGSVLSFMDIAGLVFYMPAIMRFSLLHDKTSDSIIVDSFYFTLCRTEKIPKIKAALNQSQLTCLCDYFRFCLNYPNYFYNPELEQAIQLYES